jgi:hypothetical protein
MCVERMQQCDNIGAWQRSGYPSADVISLARSADPLEKGSFNAGTHNVVCSLGVNIQIWTSSLVVSVEPGQISLR